MFDFFEKILGFVEYFFSFLTNLTRSLLSAVLAISTGTSFLMQLSGLMPTIVSSSILIVLFMAILKFILGR